MAIATFWASCSIDFCSSKTLLYGMIGSLHPPFIISGGGWIKIGGWFVPFGVCSLWRSDIYEIPLSRPVSPLIVQGSARLSPGDIEIIVVLCGRGTGCGYFSGIVPGLLCLGVQIRCAQVVPANQRTPRLELKAILSVAGLKLERIIWLIIISKYCRFRFFPHKW